MSSRRNWIGAALLLISLGLSASAAAAEAVKMLTLEEAIGLALTHNREVLKTREFERYVDGVYVEARASAFPHLTLNGAGGRNHDEPQAALTRSLPDTDFRSGKAELTQALFTWGQIGAAIRAAKVGYAMADERQRIAEHAVIKDTTAAFYDVLLAREFHALAAENLQQKQRHLDEAERKHAAGVATDYDVLSARVASENARPDVIKMENLVRTARENLRFIIGIDDPEIDVTGQLEGPSPETPTFEEALASAMANRPELAAIKYQASVAREMVKIAGAGDKPKLALAGSYGWDQYEIGPMKTDGEVWSASLVLSYPIFDGLATHGKVMQAKSDLASLDLDQQKAIEGVRLEVRVAVNATHEANEIMKALSGTVEQAERLLKMAEKGYELGVMRKLDVDDAELNLQAARSNLARAKRDCLVSHIELQRVMGKLNLKAEG